MLKKCPFATPLLLALALGLSAGEARAAKKDADGQMAPEKQREIARIQGTLQPDTYNALLSGDWDGNIWCPVRTFYKDPYDRVKRGARPGKDNYVQIAGPGRIVVRLKTAAEIWGYYQCTPDSNLVIEKGGLLKVNIRFDGQGSRNSSGSFTVQKGGALVVGQRFILAGRLQECGTGAGVFNQDGGDVTLSCPIFLTGIYTLTSSAQAKGVYHLREGTLNISPKPDQGGGIQRGIGTGVFDFAGGVLSATALSEDLENTQKGALAPGGEGKVGETALTGDAPAVYTQGKNARLCIDIAGRSKHDALVWKNNSKTGRVVLEGGTTLWVSYLGGYRASTGASFDVIECDQLEVRGPLTVAGPAGEDFSCEVVQGPNPAVRLKYGR